MELTHGASSVKGYLVKQVPFHRAKVGTYFMFLLGEIFDLLQGGKWAEARALVSMGLVAGEQAALDQWNWGTAWLLTGLPDPPFHLLQESLGPNVTRPHARLADHSWIAAAASYLKEMAILQESRKPARQTGPPKGDDGEEPVRPRPKRGAKGGAAVEGQE